MQFDETVYLKPTTADKYTVAYLYYKQGDAGGTYAAEEVAESCESITGASSQFTLYEKNDPRYLYTSMVVFQEVGIGDFYSDGDGCYYTYSDLTSKTSPYYRITYDFTSYTYSTETKTGSGYVPSGFNETTGTRYQTTIAKNGKSNSSIPTGLTFLNSSTTSDAYVQYYAGMGLQAGTAALTLSVTNATANTVSYLYYKQGDADNTNTVAATSESEPITISGTASEVLPVKTTSYKLYTRLEVFTKDVPVEVSAAGYATYVSAYNLDFTSTSIKAYTATVNTSTGVVTLNPINKVPAGTPVVLYKDGGATENIPVAASTDEVGDNDLIAGTGAAVPTDAGGGKYNYILNNVSGIGFYRAAGQTVAANRAYLQTTYVSSGARGMTLEFADDTLTGINEAEAATEAVAKEGKFFENGKLIIFKKGMKFYANGQVIK